MRVQDDWWEVIEQVADGVPSEIDYLYDNWTQERIARHYALKVKRTAIRNYNT